MKIFCLNLFFLVSVFLSACRSGPAATGPAATLPPIVALQPEPTSTAIKPLESQVQVSENLAVDAPLIAYNEIKEGQLNAPAAGGK